MSVSQGARDREERCGKVVVTIECSSQFDVSIKGKSGMVTKRCQHSSTKVKKDHCSSKQWRCSNIELRVWMYQVQHTLFTFHVCRPVITAVYTILISSWVSQSVTNKKLTQNINTLAHEGCLQHTGNCPLFQQPRHEMQQKLPSANPHLIVILHSPCRIKFI